MKISILGTGHVAQLLAPALAIAGHDVVLGSRTPADTSAPTVTVSLSEAVQRADVLINATPGVQSVETLSALGASSSAGKTIIDLANATTPTLELSYPNSSLGERLQQALPDANVVKSMNTAAMSVIANPSSLTRSSVFLSGDDTTAKETTARLLEDLGWTPSRSSTSEASQPRAALSTTSCSSSHSCRRVARSSTLRSCREHPA